MPGLNVPAFFLFIICSGFIRGIGALFDKLREGLRRGDFQHGVRRSLGGHGEKALRVLPNSVLLRVENKYRRYFSQTPQYEMFFAFL